MMPLPQEVADSYRQKIDEQRGHRQEALIGVWLLPPLSHLAHIGLDIVGNA